MAKMLKQAQEMQKQMESVQSELSDIIVDSESGGGMVKVNSINIRTNYNKITLLWN